MRVGAKAPIKQEGSSTGKPKSLPYSTQFLLSRFFAAVSLRFSGCMQGLVKVGDDVRRMFRTDAETHHVGRDTGKGPAFFALLLMGGDGRNGGDALDPAKIGRPPDALQAVEELSGFVCPALNAE